jgi:hypothetical protein
MPTYRLAGQDFYFPQSIIELEPFERKDGAIETAIPFVIPSFSIGESPVLISRTKGWVGSAQRMVGVYDIVSGFLMKIEGGGDFLIALHGETISKSGLQAELTKLDREIIIGPLLVMAMALRGVWSLHASAAIYKENILAFLGESEQGKSTLAAYLSQNLDWSQVADDILPVKNDNGLQVLPHFPQLKLPAEGQPGVLLPEYLPLKTICVLEPAEADQMPALQKMNTAQTVQALLSHIAGTRMFTAELLTQHLEFSTQAAKQISAFRLTYPHRLDTLPLVRNLLENIC